MNHPNEIGIAVDLLVLLLSLILGAVAVLIGHSRPFESDGRMSDLNGLHSSPARVSSVS